jgi:DNA-binding NtrC family response regulator
MLRKSARGAVSKSCSVLVVEDDPGVRELLRHVLTDEGNHVEVARNGQEMRAALDERVFNAVIIDVRLPGAENGIALARHAEQHGCAIVLITGDYNHSEALARTGYPYLLKPFRVERLLEVTEEAVDVVSASCRIRRRRDRTT